MAQQLGDVAVLQAYSTHELSIDDALESATIAEQALAADAPERCSDALDFGVECVAAASRRRIYDHFHVTMCNLRETVERAREALETDYEEAESLVRQAITALRRTVAAVEDRADPTPGHRYL